VKYSSGTVRSIPDFAPLAVSTRTGKEPTVLVTLPRVAFASGASIRLARLM
jgi:hypothetical protein